MINKKESLDFNFDESFNNDVNNEDMKYFQMRIINNLHELKG